MLDLLKHLLALWPPFGNWSDTPAGGPYTIAGGQVFCPGPAPNALGVAGCPRGGAAGQCSTAGATGGQVTA
ncbi:MAG: hypothetical protein ABR915_09135 [Thermoguttaceae bacterium]